MRVGRILINKFIIITITETIKNESHTYIKIDEIQKMTDNNQNR